MSAVNECPICMEPIESTRNCTTTECGHCFHAKCLMTSVAHNGFGCPYCRTRMADDVADEESEYDDESESVEDELYDDYALRGLRFFNNNLDGEAHDEEDVEEEDFEHPEEDVEEDEASVETETKSETESVEEEENDDSKSVETETKSEKSEEDLEVITIDDIDYCTNNEENGFIWELTQEGEQGTKVGYLKDGEPFFYAEEN